MDKKLKFICATAFGIALYVAVSMLIKIPVIGHISLDLGYIVLAVYCYIMGPASGAIVGGIGCTFVSLLASGWFPAGWLLGNAFIGGLFAEPDIEKMAAGEILQSRYVPLLSASSSSKLSLNVYSLVFPY